MAITFITILIDRLITRAWLFEIASITITSLSVAAIAVMVGVTMVFGALADVGCILAGDGEWHL